MPALAVIAKAPAPGRVKTRLCPPFRPDQAAAIAEAALLDTLASAGEVAAERHVLVLDGAPEAWLPPSFELLPQRGGGLAERLAGAFEDLGGPALLIGMDTPQVTGGLLADGLARLSESDAVLGPASDGGYWAIGLRQADRRVFERVPMSCASTARVQLERLAACGLRVAVLPELRDFDTYDDAVQVAAMVPQGRFARALAAAT
ncbi:MAG: TIGR04282 family arsenosugar biosynthesis glycosyltransferase [Solirubrobacteraceae bacterium]